MISSYDRLPSLRHDIRQFDSDGTAKVGMTLGGFDIPHEGYRDCVDHLKGLVGHNGLVAVGVWGDRTMRVLKGEGRPVRTAARRVRMIEGIKGVDIAFEVPDEALEQALGISEQKIGRDAKRLVVRSLGSLMAAVQLEPDVFMLGGYCVLPQGSLALKGGHVMRVEPDPTYRFKDDSTTDILSRMGQVAPLPINGTPVNGNGGLESGYEVDLSGLLARPTVYFNE